MKKISHIYKIYKKVIFRWYSDEINKNLLESETIIAMQLRNFQALVIGIGTFVGVICGKYVIEYLFLIFPILFFAYLVGFYLFYRIIFRPEITIELIKRL